ncbi:hypothetical protein ABZ383_14660 [Streptomyces sp. NPDC005900]|uniref:DUF6461 domain-containing protein n=1 Tax=Streptomyces sp. NPDC005900 TaxID=3154569 RepID=UPI0033C697FC
MHVIRQRGSAPHRPDGGRLASRRITIDSREFNGGRFEMSDGLRWTLQAYPEGFSVSFTKGLDAARLIDRIGPRNASTLLLSREQAEAIDLFNHHPDETDLESVELDEEECRNLGFIDRNVHILRIGEIEGWAFALQSFDTYAASRRIAELASATTRHIAFSCTSNADVWVQYSVDGAVVDSFDPLYPPRTSEGGLNIRGLEGAADPIASVLTHLESTEGLSIPREADFTSLPSIAVI